MSYRLQLRNVPIAIVRLRRRAGYKTVSAAAQAIRKKTGHAFSRPTLSKWESGHITPSLPALLAFLEGLGYDLTTLHDELERATGEDLPERPRRRQDKDAVERLKAEAERLMKELDALKP